MTPRVVAKKTVVKNRDVSTMGPLTPEDTMLSAGARLCSEYCGVLRADVNGAIAGEDPEYVHRMRIAIRKARFVLQLWAPFLAAKETEIHKRELKRLAVTLGQARDADVLGLRFKSEWDTIPFSAPFKDFIMRELRRREKAAKDDLALALSSGRFERLLTSLERLFERKRSGVVDNPPLRAIVPRLFGIAVKKAGRYAGRKLDYEELHSLRIAFKRLRYMTEFFGVLYKGNLKGLLRRFKKIQDILGGFCDAQVAELFLKTLAVDETAPAPEARTVHLELGGLLFMQRNEALQQYRRFEKKAAMLPELLKLLRNRTKHV
jgi:CHAD domain-containing protein